MIRLRTPMQAALPCLCAFLLMGIYALELLPQLNLTAVNLICLLLACLALLPGIVSAVNARKAAHFGSSLAIALAALAVNLRGQLPASLSALSAWEALWAGLAAVCGICLAAVLLRLMRWSQENWEQERKDAQDRRRNRRESRRSWWRARSQYRNSRVIARRAYKRQAEEARRINRLKWKNLCQSKKWLKKMLEVWEWQQVWSDLPPEPAEPPEPRPQNEHYPKKDKSIRFPRIPRRVPGWGWAIILAASVIVVCAIGALLIWIPNIQGLDGTVEDWLQTLRNMIVPLILTGVKQEPDGKSITPDDIGTVQVLLFYLMIVIFSAVILTVAVYLVAMLFKRIWTGPTDQDKNADGSDFYLLKTYASPFALLLVSFIALYALSSGRVGVKWFTSSWATLFFTILFIMMLLSAFELVRLVLEQCGRANSALKRVVFLFFIAALDFFADIIFGVLKGLHIESTISSLLTLVLPGDPDEVAAQALEKAKRIFHHQINKVKETEDNSGSGNAGTPAGAPSPGRTEPERKAPHGNRFFRRKVWGKGKGK